MHKPAIEVQNATVIYRGLKNIRLKNIMRRQEVAPPSAQGFTAVRDVSFSVESGQIIGIIGTNGSGKSTLLNTISGVFSPNSGTVTIHDNRTVSLLSIGVGFQRSLSGYDNIYLSGLLLGFTKQQIDERLTDIIEFSELGDFIYRPVKTYSSGMYSKLAFSITAIMEADILLIDEILSVGDASFKKKSYAKMKSLILKDDRTVLIVSHNMSTIRDLCDKVLWMEKGTLCMYDDTETVVSAYEKTII